MSSLDEYEPKPAPAELTRRFINKPAGVLGGTALADKLIEIRGREHQINPQPSERCSELSLLGFPALAEMTADDLLGWGDLFMTVNSGLEVNQELVIEVRRTNGYAPSVARIEEVFGTFEAYAEQLGDLFATNNADRQMENQEKRRIIEEAVNTEQVPLKVFDSAESEDDIFALYGRYVVADRIYKKHEVVIAQDTIINIITRASGANFTSLVKKETALKGGGNPVSSGDVELEARVTGLFEDIYPNPHLKKLNIARLRGEVQKPAERRGLSFVV